MDETSRQFIQSPLYQGVDETIAYTLTTTPWGSTPSSVSVVAKEADGTDVSGDVLSGSASVASDVITTPTVQSLTAGKVYRLEIKFTTAGNVLEAWGLIRART